MIERGMHQFSIEPAESVATKRTGHRILMERTIGKILMDSGKLDRDGVQRVFRLHKKNGMRFGEAAIKLKLVTKADVQHALFVQFDYPCLRPGDAAVSAEVVAAYHPQSAQSEALRDLRSRLLVTWFDGGHKTLAVVSPNSGEGRTYVTANLAVAFSQLGEKTLLIDADLRAPRQHRIFNVTNPIGLSTILSGRAGMEAIEPISHFGNLSVLAAGPVPPNPLELLSRPEFSKLLRGSARRYDVILVDTAAGERGSDAQTVAGRAKGALIVARQDRARIADVAAIAENIAAYGAQVVGAVLNRL